MTDLSADIRIEDLPPEFRAVAEEIGLSAAVRLVRARGGEEVYVPKEDSVSRAARNRAILAEFNGKNYRELARRYDLTVKTIRQVVAGGCGRDAYDFQQKLPGIG